MRIKWLVILIWGLLTCQFSYGQLNRTIDKSQKVAISKSPFKTATGIDKELVIQRKVRLQYLYIIDSLKSEFPKDTILLAENYDYICFDCPASFIQIQVKDTYLTLRYNYELKQFEAKYQRLTKSFRGESGYYLSDIHELRTIAFKNDDWNVNPEKYGTENCLDGGHTFFTILYPDKKILSMYMRCWINKEMRKLKE